MTRSGKMGTPCECNQEKCHGPNGCIHPAVEEVHNMYVCTLCADRIYNLIMDKYEGNA